MDSGSTWLFTGKDGLLHVAVKNLIFFFFLRGCLVVTSLSLFLFLDVEMYSKISACSHWMCLFCFTVPSWSSVMMKMTAETWKKFGECFSPCVAIAPFM